MFTKEGRPGTVAAEDFEQFIWVTTGVNGRTPFKKVSRVSVYKAKRARYQGMKQTYMYFLL